MPNSCCVGRCGPYRPLRAPKASAVPEKTFMAQLIQVARVSGWITYYTFDSRHSPEGFPDRIVVRPEPGRGPVYAWELKTARGKVTMAQQLWLTALDGKCITAGLGQACLFRRPGAPAPARLKETHEQRRVLHLWLIPFALPPGRKTWCASDLF